MNRFKLGIVAMALLTGCAGTTGTDVLKKDTVTTTPTEQLEMDVNQATLEAQHATLADVVIGADVDNFPSPSGIGEQLHVCSTTVTVVASGNPVPPATIRMVCAYKPSNGWWGETPPAPGTHARVSLSPFEATEIGGRQNVWGGVVVDTGGASQRSAQTVPLSDRNIHVDLNTYTP